MSKGSKRRPEDYNKVRNNWDNIFEENPIKHSKEFETLRSITNEFGELRDDLTQAEIEYWIDKLKEKLK